MSTSEEYARMMARSRIDGALVGVMWAVGFLFTVAGFTNPAWSFAAMIISIASPFYALSRMKKFRRRVLGNSMSFRHALGYAIMMMICATLIFAAVQLVYFQFLDNGYFLSITAIFSARLKWQKHLGTMVFRGRMSSRLLPCFPKCAPWKW